MINLDSELDRQLLLLLSENARCSISELARQLAVARATVQQHMSKLEQAGVIDGYTVKLGAALQQSLLRAQVMINVEPKQLAAVSRQLKAMTAVRALHSISGQQDLIAEVEELSTQALDDCIDNIAAIDGVQRTVTSIILATRFRK